MKTNIQNKKIYSKPLLEVIVVDHEISLVMVSPGDIPTDSEFSAKQKDPVGSSPVQVSRTSVDSDPFGGSAPQY